MIFSSPIFLYFFVAFYALHLTLPKNWKLLLLILGSTLFYSYWNPYYTWVPFLLIMLAFYGANWVERGKITPKARILKTVIVISALSLPLIIFKYSNFLCQNFINRKIEVLSLSLPLGISFITFSLIAYVVEVYKRNFPVENNLTRFTAYTLFFPHLIAGPILRPSELIPQLDNLKQVIQKPQGFLGITLFSFGLWKKLVFADPISTIVDKVYQQTELLNAWDYLLAIYGFSLQIYCDFSGYTDMALGIAMLMGISLPNNFERPYLSASIVDFWRRWHITLSNWLRDYIYIPLGGNRLGLSHQIRNVFITMVLGGLWHGASWTFILWGFGHAMLISVTHLLRLTPLLVWVTKVPKIIKILFTFHLVTFLWILFRAPDFSTFIRVLTGPLVAGYEDIGAFVQKNIFLLFLLFASFILYRWDDHRCFDRFSKLKTRYIFWSIMIFIWLSAITISMGSSEKFVYFDF